MPWIARLSCVLLCLVEQNTCSQGHYELGPCCLVVVTLKHAFMLIDLIYSLNPVPLKREGVSQFRGHGPGSDTRKCCTDGGEAISCCPAIQLLLLLGPRTLQAGRNGKKLKAMKRTAISLLWEDIESLLAADTQYDRMMVKYCKLLLGRSCDNNYADAYCKCCCFVHQNSSANCMEPCLLIPKG